MSRIRMGFAISLMAVSLSLAVQVPVSMVDFAFSPETVRVAAGDSVVWTNNGTFLHTSTSGVSGVWDSIWDSGNMAHGASFVRGFAADGTFPYFCRHHYLSGMTGVVLVGASGANETPRADENSAGMASFPDPFRYATTIRFAPAGPGSGSVRVFDASGKLVRTLPAAHVTSVTWDGRNSQGRETGPGVYFCRYAAGALAVTRLR
jgi:plastocyanin